MRARCACPHADVEIGCRTATVAHLANIVYGLQRAIKWDPLREQIVGDEEAGRGRTAPGVNHGPFDFQRGQVHVFGLTSYGEKRLWAEKWTSPRPPCERLRRRLLLDAIWAVLLCALPAGGAEAEEAPAASLERTISQLPTCDWSQAGAAEAGAGRRHRPRMETLRRVKRWNCDWRRRSRPGRPRPACR